MSGFVPTQILVTASQELEEQVAEELSDDTFPANQNEQLKRIVENTVADVTQFSLQD